MSRANLDRFFAEQHEKLNVEKTFNHFMGKIDPYADVKNAVDQLDRHFNDTYRARNSHGIYRIAGKEPNITPAPDLKEVIINVALNPNLKYKSNGKRQNAR